MLNFNDKVVLVTGGGAGIGRATVSAFAEHGATVVALEIDERRADELRATGANVQVIHGDATDPRIAAPSHSSVDSAGPLRQTG